jgi:hypothetical protein
MLTITGVIVDYLHATNSQHELKGDDYHALQRALKKGLGKCFDKKKNAYLTTAHFESSSDGNECEITDAHGTFNVCLITKDIQHENGDGYSLNQIWGSKRGVEAFLHVLHSEKGTLEVYSLQYQLDRTPYYVRPVYAPEFFGSEIFEYVDKRVQSFLHNQDFYEKTGLPYRLEIA